MHAPPRVHRLTPSSHWGQASRQYSPGAQTLEFPKGQFRPSPRTHAPSWMTVAPPVVAWHRFWKVRASPRPSWAQTGWTTAGQTPQGMQRMSSMQPVIGSGAGGLAQVFGEHSGGESTGQPVQQPLEQVVVPRLQSSTVPQVGTGPQSREHAGSAASTCPLQSSSRPLVQFSRAPG